MIMHGYAKSPGSESDMSFRDRIDAISRNLTKFLRHRAGRPTNNHTGVRWDNGVWASWEDVLKDDRIWMDNKRDYRENDAQILMAIERERSHALCCCILQTKKEQGKSRIHIMAVKLSARLCQGGGPETLKFTQFLINRGIVRRVDLENLSATGGMIVFDLIQI